MYILIFYLCCCDTMSCNKHARKNNYVIKRMKILLIKMVSQYSVNISLFNSPAKRSVYSIIRDVGQNEKWKTLCQSVRWHRYTHIQMTFDLQLWSTINRKLQVLPPKWGLSSERSILVSGTVALFFGDVELLIWVERDGDGRIFHELVSAFNFTASATENMSVNYLVKHHHI